VYLSVACAAEALQIFEVVGAALVSWLDVVDFKESCVSATWCLAMVVGSAENFSFHRWSDGRTVWFSDL
jgi:hypothetical protein